MAITNAQQYQQLVNKPANGKRPGYKGREDRDSQYGGDYSNTGQSLGGGNGGNKGRDLDFQQRGMSKTDYDRAVSKGDIGQNFSAKPNFFENLQNTNQTLSLKNLYDIKTGAKKMSPFAFANYLNSLNPALTVYESTDEDDIMDTGYGMTGKDLTRTDEIADAINKSQTVGIDRDEYLDAFFGKDNPQDPRNKKERGDGIQDPCKGPNPPAYCFVGIRSVEPEVKEEETFTSNLRLLAGGGMADETVGGIMDFESSRQMYGLGKLVKKITRGVKKIAKSPIGKAAIVGGLGYLANSASGGAFSKFFRDSIFGKALPFKSGLPGGGVERTGGLLDFIKNNKMLTGLAGTTALSYFMTPKEEEKETLYTGADIADPRYIMNNPQLFTNTRIMAEGGSTEEKEPVAKKVMPLLDMDGKEKDYRETGGFVDMGRMEKADDVPARLSKNEFVFTADAVRNAGDGSVDKGAEVMYNMMKNLESGGDVSEESQGLDGARKMFQTSQRLEEVL
jgi:hypothetical protein